MEWNVLMVASDLNVLTTNDVLLVKHVRDSSRPESEKRFPARSWSVKWRWQISRMANKTLFAEDCAVVEVLIKNSKFFHPSMQSGVPAASPVENGNAIG